MIWIRAKGSRRFPFAVFASVLGVGLSVAGCAELMADDALQQDVAQLRQDVNGLMLAARRGRAEPDTLSQIERRGREQAIESTQQMAALSARIESLNTELTRLSVRIDQVSQRLESLGRQAPPGGVSPRRAEPARPSPAPEVSPPATVGPSTSVAQPTSRTGVPTPEESYQAAYLDFSKGRYSLAIPAFRDFVRRFPDSGLADSAQYGIGESYFSMARASADGGRAEQSKRELEQAVREFRKVIVNYPRASKVPTALYKEALALAELKQTGLAQVRLQYLLDHFPQSEEAPLAKERLAGLKQ